MSDINISVEQIEQIVPHPQADRLEIAKILGTQTLVGKDQFKAGDLVVFFPPDMLLPEEVSSALGVQKYLKTTLFQNRRFPCRVAAARLRGVPSYGFVAEIPADMAHARPGTDVTSYYGAEKYEPPVRAYRGFGGGTGEVWGGLASQPVNFQKYTDIQNYWKYKKALESGLPVRVTEKAHGTNSRVGLLKVDGDFQFVGGSHRTARKQYDPEGRLSVYWEPLQHEEVLDMLSCLCNEEHDVIVYGELYGPGVQDLDYGVAPGTVGWRVFDITVNGYYLDWQDVKEICQTWNVATVPLIYEGPFNHEKVEEWVSGPTLLAEPDQIRSAFKGREGVVITPLEETYSDFLGGRLILKAVSADYLARKNSQDNGDL